MQGTTVARDLCLDYLTDMPTDICNKYGLSKTLLTRRETIRLKHLMKSLFVYRIFTEEQLDLLFKTMQFKGLMSYIEFLSNQLRGIYKITREFEATDADDIVKEDKARTITNKHFHTLYRWLCEEGFTIFINSANPSEETIRSYLVKYELKMPSRIYANKGRVKKIVQLKVIASKWIERPRFCIDDELDCLMYGNLLFYQCYQYTSGGKIKSKTLCIK